MKTADRIALRELLNEAKCRMERARRRADEAALNCSVQERAYADACHRVRELERAFEKIIKPTSFWREWLS